MFTSLGFQCCFIFFFFNHTAPTEIYTLPLHVALPISPPLSPSFCSGSTRDCARIWTGSRKRILGNIPLSSARLPISSANSAPQPIPPRQLQVDLHKIGRAHV